jgi:hypothetical protein
LKWWWAAAAALTGGCGERAEPATRPEAAAVPRVEAERCYRSDEAVLARLSPATVNGSSWLRLRGTAGDTGSGRLIDSSGAVLQLAWARAAGDSLDVRGADDFLQFSARLATAGPALSGPARLYSDAQLDRDSDGRMVPAERVWNLTAATAPCDSAPGPWNGAP